MSVPHRIVCLSGETADWLWRLGAWGQVAGVTAYFELPPGAAVKPRVSGFSSASLESILKLDPDLVVGFSDVQAGIAAQLILRGCPVLVTNQRTLAEVESTLSLISRCVDRIEQGEALLREFRARLAAVAPPLVRPRVYFEEWNDPLITGIAWVSELIERAGGMDIFERLRSSRQAPKRVVTFEEVVAEAPEVIFVSWCGRPAHLASIAARPGWQDLPAVRSGRVYEVSAADILQPGFGLVRGYEEIQLRLSAMMAEGGGQ